MAKRAGFRIMRPINILSLFDGCSCGLTALKRSGFKINNYYAAEIDKNAIQISKKNHPEIIHLGDVIKLREMLEIFPQTLGQIDLLIGGSPCQAFSFCGKQLNFNDPRGQLFFDYIKIKEILSPKYFLLENVKMKKAFQDVISKYIGVEPIEINSNLVSAQNRKRLYWCNWKVKQPNDRYIYLEDILETQGRGMIKNKGNFEKREEKSMCLDANYFKGPDNHGQRTIIIDTELIKEKRNPKITTTPPACITERRTEEAKKIRSENLKKGRDFSPRRSKELVTREDKKSNCLTATFSNNEHSLVDNNYKWRKLTPLECERLQTLPDNYTEGVSNTQRYKMIGNGWTVDVICHILNYIKKGFEL
jgi:DNA-cytosine methyltransferase